MASKSTKVDPVTLSATLAEGQDKCSTSAREILEADLTLTQEKDVEVSAKGKNPQSWRATLKLSSLESTQIDTGPAQARTDCGPSESD